MRLLVAMLPLLAACDLGIGSDPNAGPHPCLPGNELGSAGCFTPRANIAIDAVPDDWAAVAPVSVSPVCAAPPCDGLAPVAIQLAAGGPLDRDPTFLNVRVSFVGPLPTADPNLRFALTLSASPLRPATAGVDRLIVGTEGLHYEKNGYTFNARVAPRPYQWAFTPDGFEAAIDDLWLTYQGAGLLTVTVERKVGAQWQAIAPIDPMAICWSWYEFGTHTCEVPL